MRKRISAVVLAAGKSQRMGSLKQLLPFGDRTVLQTVVDMLQSVNLDQILIVVGHRCEDVEASLPSGVDVVRNDRYEEGMFSSVLTGLDALSPETDGLLLLLGDQPQIRPEVVGAVIDRFQGGQHGIVLPEMGGKRGHPVLIDVRRYGDEIKALDGSEGLKPVVRGHPEDTEVVLIDDEAILRDMDTPEDYERELRLRKD
jgi:molybdenum cofactor cytidylyltransferase